MSKVVGIIPARHKSTRLPGKPLALIKGKSLIQHTYENAKLCHALDDLIVATDDMKIFEHVKQFGGEATLTSTECKTGTERVCEAYKNESWLQGAEIVVNIQGDEPCIEADVIEQVVLALKNDNKASMSTALTQLTDENEFFDPNCVKCVIDKNGYAIYFSRGAIPTGKTKSMQKNITYYKHLGIYGFRTNFLMTFSELTETPLQKAEDLEQLKVIEHGYKIKTVTVQSKSIGVDTPEDIKKIEELL